MKLHSNISGQGQPFIILHGFLGMGDNWKTLGKQFSEDGFEVHLVDQRNHGRSPHADDFNYDVLTQDLKIYCDDHKLANIVLLGHSMGGKTAMFFVAKYPEMVSKLIVADIAPRFYPIHHEAILEGLGSLDFNVLKSRNEVDHALSNYVSDFGTRQFLLKNIFWVEKEQLGLRMNLKGLIKNESKIGEALPSHFKFEGKTLFLRGDKSNYISQNEESLIKEQFPKAIIKTISNAGHWLHAENPKEFYETVIDFIK